MRLYTRGLISEEEADVLLADLKNQTANLRLLIGAVETDLSRSEESKLAAMTTEAWLMALRKNLSEVEEDTEEAYLHRRELAKLLVQKITVDRDDDGRAKVDITYRFGPPEAAREADCLVGVQGTCEIRQADTASGSNDECFGNGSKEDTANPSVVDGGIPPNKSDLKFFGVYQEGSTSTGFLNLFWSRVQDPSGTTNTDPDY